MAEPNQKVDRETSELQVDLMLEALGVDVPKADSRELLIRAYQDGRLDFDGAKEEGVYRLAKPIQLQNGTSVQDVKFHEPNGAEMQYISTGQRVEVDAAKGTGFMDLGQSAKATIRFLAKVSGLDLGVAERMKRRDLVVVEAIAGFFQ